MNEEAQIPLPQDSTRIGPQFVPGTEMQGRMNPIFEFEPQPEEKCSVFF